MKIIKTSVDLPEVRYKALAVFMGWQEKVMTATESPNYEIENPETFTDFIIRKDSEYMKGILEKFAMQEAEYMAKAKEAEAEAIREQAREQVIPVVEGFINYSIE